VPIDCHVHYVPPQLLDAITRKGSEIGVKLVPSGGATPALHFDYGLRWMRADRFWLSMNSSIAFVTTSDFSRLV
jgi:hypothetical protein